MLTTATTIEAVLAQRAVRSVYQPIVELATGRVVAYEALARGPEGTQLESPLALFDAARRAGLVTELDWACRVAALEGAIDAGLRRPLRLFVNAAADSLASEPPADAQLVLERALRDFDVVLEITEQAITTRPADMLHTVASIRERGLAVALDDVGADPGSLALMPFISPQVIKLDLRLVQDRPSVEIAAIANAATAEAERGGATLVAEGIETPEHVEIARALGADYGQGWLYGRPTSHIDPTPTTALRVARHRASVSADDRTPFEIVSVQREVRRGDKSLLLTISRQLELHAARQGAAVVVLAAFQDARHFTAPTARLYAQLAEQAAFVGALARGLGPQPTAGVRGASLGEQDKLAQEWNVVVTAPHFAAAFTARDLGDTGPDMQRRFDFALTHDRDLTMQAARPLMHAVAPHHPTSDSPRFTLQRPSR